MNIFRIRTFSSITINNFEKSKLYLSSWNILGSQFVKNVPPYWQLECDRLFDRVIDNSKVLAATGMKQSELKALFDGLKMEIERCPKDHQ